MRQGKLLLLVVVVFLCLLAACSGPDDSEDISAYLNFADILPKEWQHVRTWRLDTNHDDEMLEWVVLYRFDLSDEDELCNSPIAAVVYQPDDRKPPCVIPYELYPQGDPDRHYLCEYTCTVVMGDVLSGLTGPELLVRDHHNDEMVRLSMFYWKPGQEEYQPRGHFSGNRITVEQDKVTVDQRLPGRAQLVMRYTYLPRDDENKTYYQKGGSGMLVKPYSYELDFCQGEPKDVVLSPYPEKVVLAFYNHYTDSKKDVSEYFTEEGWERVDKCAAGQCGCTVARNKVKDVRVTQLQPVDETCSSPSSSHQCEKYGPDRASVHTAVICEPKRGAEDAETILLWHLVWEGDRWKLDSVDVKQTQTGESEGGEQ